MSSSASSHTAIISRRFEGGWMQGALAAAQSHPQGEWMQAPLAIAQSHPQGGWMQMALADAQSHPQRVDVAFPMHVIASSK